MVRHKIPWGEVTRERRRPGRLRDPLVRFLYGGGRVREEQPQTATPEGYDGTHVDGAYRAGHHDEEER